MAGKERDRTALRHLHSYAKEIIYKVNQYIFLEQKSCSGPSLVLCKATERTAKATFNVSVRIVIKICREGKTRSDGRPLPISSPITNMEDDAMKRVTKFD